MKWCWPRPFVKSRLYWTVKVKWKVFSTNIKVSTFYNLQRINLIDWTPGFIGTKSNSKRILRGGGGEKRIYIRFVSWSGIRWWCCCFSGKFWLSFGLSFFLSFFALHSFPRERKRLEQSRPVSWERKHKTLRFITKKGYSFIHFTNYSELWLIARRLIAPFA